MKKIFEQYKKGAPGFKGSTAHARNLFQEGSRPGTRLRIAFSQSLSRAGGLLSGMKSGLKYATELFAVFDVIFMYASYSDSVVVKKVVEGGQSYLFNPLFAMANLSLFVGLVAVVIVFAFDVAFRLIKKT